MHFQRRLDVIAIDGRHALRDFSSQPVELPAEMRDRPV
jgi:hypothetical protein